MAFFPLAPFSDATLLSVPKQVLIHASLVVRASLVIHASLAKHALIHASQDMYQIDTGICGVGVLSFGVNGDIVRAIP